MFCLYEYEEKVDKKDWSGAYLGLKTVQNEKSQNCWCSAHLYFEIWSDPVCPDTETVAWGWWDGIGSPLTKINKLSLQINLEAEVFQLIIDYFHF